MGKSRPMGRMQSPGGNATTRDVENWAFFNIECTRCTIAEAPKIIELELFFLLKRYSSASVRFLEAMLISQVAVVLQPTKYVDIAIALPVQTTKSIKTSPPNPVPYPCSHNLGSLVKNGCISNSIELYNIPFKYRHFTLNDDYGRKCNLHPSQISPSQWRLPQQGHFSPASENFCHPTLGRPQRLLACTARRAWCWMSWLVKSPTKQRGLRLPKA